MRLIDLDYYELIVDNGEYVVYNKATEIREFTTKLYPAAVQMARELDIEYGRIAQEFAIEEEKQTTRILTAH